MPCGVVHRFCCLPDENRSTTNCDPRVMADAVGAPRIAAQSPDWPQPPD
jgi:hypothetical protein